MAEIRNRGKRRDGTTRWEVRIWDPNDPTTRYAKSFKNKTDAKAWVTTMEHGFLTGTHVDPRRADRPFKEVVAAFRESWVDLEPKTRSGYEMVLRVHLIPEFGERKVSAITPAAVQSYVARLQSGGAAPGTIRNIYSVLRNALNTAVRLRIITQNPCRGIRLPRMPREEMLFLSAEEVATLAEAFMKPPPRKNKHAAHPKPRPRDRLLVYTAAYTGLRAGELLALTRADVDLLRSTLTIRRALKDISGKDTPEPMRGMQFGPTKTHASRTIALPKFLREMLSDYLSRPLPGGTGGADDLVFPSSNGLPMRHLLWYRRVFKPTVKRALPHKADLRFHDLRHTCASLLIAAGAHPKSIADRLGHGDIRITMNRYGHLLPAVDAALVEALERTYSRHTGSETSPEDLDLASRRKDLNA